MIRIQTPVLINHLLGLADIWSRESSCPYLQPALLVFVSGRRSNQRICQMCEMEEASHIFKKKWARNVKWPAQFPLVKWIPWKLRSLKVTDLDSLTSSIFGSGSTFLLGSKEQVRFNRSVLDTKHEFAIETTCGRTSGTQHIWKPEREGEKDMVVVGSIKQYSTHPNSHT